MTMIAPVCPVSKSELFLPQAFPARLPGVPVATDLASLIRTVNLITDILISVTGNLVVNNVYNPAKPPAPSNSNNTPYPEWVQVATERVNGYVYNKTPQRMDKTQRAYVTRTNVVDFQNVVQKDPDFFWKYYLKLDGMA